MSEQEDKNSHSFLKSIYRKIKGQLTQAIYTHPLIVRLVRELRFKAWIFLVRLRSTKNLDANKTIWVDPQKIEYRALEIKPDFNIGRVIGGDWDKSTKRFENLDVYASFRRRFIEGAEWDTTSFYKLVLSQLEKDRLAGDLEPQRHWGCRTKNELDERMKKIDHLYYEIKTHGYKSKKNIRKNQRLLSHDPLQFEDEVTVNIGRDGDFFFNDGRHRLAISKILKIPEIPVKVVARHTEWANFRKELISSATRGKIYQPSTHPDLQDIPSHYGHFRFDLIKENLSIINGTVLDIGAQLGYFCRRFEEEGFDCYAVEKDPVNVYLLRRLRKIENRRFRIIPQSIFDYRRGTDLSFDVVLALNIFHHFLKTRKSYEELIILLKRIKTKELFFQAHGYDEPQMIGAYRNLHPDEFADFIVKYADLANYKLIGETRDDRKIYKFTRDR